MKTLAYKQSFIGLLDYFIPAQIKLDLGHHTRAQILAGVILLNILTAISTAFGVGFGMELNQFNAIVAYVVITHCVILYASALVVLRLFGTLLISAHIAALSGFIAVLGPTLITGGYRESPFIQLFVLIPVLVFLTAGFRSGVIWSSLTIIALLSLLFVDQILDFHFQLLQKNDIGAFYRLLPFITVSMIVFALMVYELISESLRRQLYKERNRFAFRASHDPLTDLPNRAEFQARLQHGLENTKINKTSLALIYIDLDGFKPINDNYGHHVGDQVLKMLASRLRSMVRQQDTVARLGGDEFAMILTGVQQIRDVENIVAKTLKVIAEPMEIDGTCVTVHGSVGIALSPKHSIDWDMLCRLADKAMYRAKETKNTYCVVADEDMNTATTIA